MNTVKSDITSLRFWRSLSVRLIVIAVSVLLIVWFMPRDEASTLHYDVGRPWMYGSFIAPFDFPIYKTDEVIKQEQDSLLKDYQPYYNVNRDVETKEVDKFLADYPGALPGLPRNAKAVIVETLHAVYQTGILGDVEHNRMAEDTANMIRLVADKQAVSVPVGDIYSSMSAYEAMVNNPALAKFQREVRQLNLTNYIQPNLYYDKERNSTEQDDILSTIPQASGMVLNGQKVVDRGEIVTPSTFRVLQSFEKELQRRHEQKNDVDRPIFGQTLFVAILLILFTVYLDLYRKDYFKNWRALLMCYTLIVVFPILVSLFMEHNFFSVYILPFAMAPMFIRIFLDSRTAYVAHVTMILICAAAVKYQYEFIIIQLVAGIVAIFSLRELTRRSQMFKAALFVTIASCLTYFALRLITYSSDQQTVLDFGMYYHLIANGIILLIAYPLMWVIEKMFGFVSSVTLFELSNTNKGLLRKLSEDAPGTFQHSITVSNLAEEIAQKIRNAKPLLVRTGALYHDIGKMVNSTFFTENRVGLNPHQKLTNQQSAEIIIGHVKEGVRLAEENNLPPVIIDFIRTHHGAGLVKYFYVKEQNEHPNVVINKAPFTYPGPNPSTLEQAILMMADGVEAASRSLKEYKEENIKRLVNSIIDNDVAQGYFSDCPITFRDISIAKSTLINRLMSIYHTRIQYPELSKEAKEEIAKSEREKEKAEAGRDAAAEVQAEEQAAADEPVSNDAAAAADDAKPVAAQPAAKPAADDGKPAAAHSAGKQG